MEGYFSISFLGCFGRQVLSFESLELSSSLIHNA